MKFHKVTVFVFLGCAAFVLGNAQAPPDDDDFDFDGSGFEVQWTSSTAAPEADGRSASTTSWHEPELHGSGSGQRSDDEEYDDADEYADSYEYDYDYPAENDSSISSSSSSGGGGSSSWAGGKHDETDTEETSSKPVGVVHSLPPVNEEKTVHSEHKPTLGAEHHPESKPVPTHGVNNYDDDDSEERDLVIPPEVTLQEMEDIENELQEVKEKELELEREVELERQREADRVGDMDGLGTKAVDRNTSFFAQPGILAAVVGGAVVGLLCAILLVMLIVYRMRKKDEGSYPVDEPKRSLTGGNSYSKNKEFYA